MVVVVAAVGVHAHDLVWWGLYGILRCRWMLHIVRRLPVLHTSTESAHRSSRVQTIRGPHSMVQTSQSRFASYGGPNRPCLVKTSVVRRRLVFSRSD